MLLIPFIDTFHCCYCYLRYSDLLYCILIPVVIPFVVVVHSFVHIPDVDSFVPHLLILLLLLTLFIVVVVIQYCVVVVIRCYIPLFWLFTLLRSVPRCSFCLIVHSLLLFICLLLTYYDCWPLLHLFVPIPVDYCCYDPIRWFIPVVTLFVCCCYHLLLLLRRFLLLTLLLSFHSFHGVVVTLHWVFDCCSFLYPLRLRTLCLRYLFDHSVTFVTLFLLLFDCALFYFWWFVVCPVCCCCYDCLPLPCVLIPVCWFHLFTLRFYTLTFRCWVTRDIVVDLGTFCSHSLFTYCSVRYVATFTTFTIRRCYVRRLYSLRYIYVFDLPLFCIVAWHWPVVDVVTICSCWLLLLFVVDSIVHSFYWFDCDSDVCYIDIVSWIHYVPHPPPFPHHLYCWSIPVPLLRLLLLHSILLLFIPHSSPFVLTFVLLRVRSLLLHLVVTPFCCCCCSPRCLLLLIDGVVISFDWRCLFVHSLLFWPIVVVIVLLLLLLLHCDRPTGTYIPFLIPFILHSFGGVILIVYYIVITICRCLCCYDSLPITLRWFCFVPCVVHLFCYLLMIRFPPFIYVMMTFYCSHSFVIYFVVHLLLLLFIVIVVLLHLLLHCCWHLLLMLLLVHWLLLFTFVVVVVDWFMIHSLLLLLIWFVVVGNVVDCTLFIVVDVVVVVVDVSHTFIWIDIVVIIVDIPLLLLMLLLLLLMLLLLVTLIYTIVIIHCCCCWYIDCCSICCYSPLLLLLLLFIYCYSFHCWLIHSFIHLLFPIPHSFIHCCWSLCYSLLLLLLYIPHWYCYSLIPPPIPTLLTHSHSHSPSIPLFPLMHSIPWLFCPSPFHFPFIHILFIRFIHLLFDFIHLPPHSFVHDHLLFVTFDCSSTLHLTDFTSLFIPVTWSVDVPMHSYSFCYILEFSLDLLHSFHFYHCLGPTISPSLIHSFYDTFCYPSFDALHDSTLHYIPHLCHSSIHSFYHVDTIVTFDLIHSIPLLEGAPWSPLHLTPLVLPVPHCHHACSRSLRPSSCCSLRWISYSHTCLWCHLSRFFGALHHLHHLLFTCHTSWVPPGCHVHRLSLLLCQISSLSAFFFAFLPHMFVPGSASPPSPFPSDTTIHYIPILIVIVVTIIHSIPIHSASFYSICHSFSCTAIPRFVLISTLPLQIFGRSGWVITHT